MNEPAADEKRDLELHAARVACVCREIDSLVVKVKGVGYTLGEKHRLLKVISLLQRKLPELIIDLDRAQQACTTYDTLVGKYLSEATLVVPTPDEDEWKRDREIMKDLEYRIYQQWEQLKQLLVQTDQAKLALERLISDKTWLAALIGYKNWQSVLNYITPDTEALVAGGAKDEIAVLKIVLNQSLVSVALLRKKGYPEAAHVEVWNALRRDKYIEGDTREFRLTEFGKKRIADLMTHYGRLAPAECTLPVANSRSRMIPGLQLKQIQDTIVSAFSANDLDQLLTYHFRTRLENIAAPGPFGQQVFEVLQYFEQRGELPELISAVAHERPKRTDVQEMFRQFAANVQEAAGKPKADEETLKAYGQLFQEKPSIDLQKEGQSEAEVPIVDPGFERTTRQDLGFFDAAVFSRGLESNTHRVCRVELNDGLKTMGTGFLVGPNTILTNYHVLESVISGDHPASAVQFRFDYQTMLTGNGSDGLAVGLLAAGDKARPWLVKYAKYSLGEGLGTPDSPPPVAGELDYALVRLDSALGNGPAGGEPRGWIAVPKTQPSMVGIPYLMILQHPERKPLKLALDTAPKAELKFDGLRVRYSVNTEAGSSGSPVFDKDWNLLALHHYGDPAWKAKFNQGIPIHLIWEHLGDLAAVLGAPAAPVSKLELASAALDAITSKLEGGAIPKPSELAAAVASSTNKVFLAGAVSTLPDTIRRPVEDRLADCDRKLAKAIEDASKPGDLPKAADRFKKCICENLRFVKSVNGGELPEEYYTLWEKHGCT